MENFYTAYTKVVNDTTYYFVKKYVTFPEYKDVPAVLENYGMHTDFNRACEIAAVSDEGIRKNLFTDIQGDENSAKIIHMSIAKGLSVAQ